MINLVIIFLHKQMNLPIEIWYNVFSFLSQQSQSKFSSLWNLHNLCAGEIELMWYSNDLWFDSAYKGYIKLMKLLIKVGVNVNKQDIYLRRTALHYACFFGKKEIVEILIKAGANVNIQDNLDDTALHFASRFGHKEIVELLIKAGADVNIQEIDGSTALDYASNCGYKEIVELLIKSGANGEYFKKK